MTKLLRLTFPLLVLSLSACGGGGTPSGPSSSSSGGASINGRVRLGASASASVPASITVEVVGAGLSTPANASGEFALDRVPPGDRQLRFSGDGADATVNINEVQPAEVISMAVVVSGPSAEIESMARSLSSEVQVEGRIESLPPTQPANMLVVASRTIRVDGNTKILQGGVTKGFADLQIGMRVHVKGQTESPTILASTIEIQNTNTEIPVPINGVVQNLSGTAAAFQFNIDGREIHGDLNTQFFGDGDAPDSFSNLKEGSRVEVKGQQMDGFVYAARIHINQPGGGDPPQDQSASIEGPLMSIGGSGLNLVLNVGGTTVNTSSSTEVRRRGDLQTLEALKVGQTLHVVGKRNSNGSIDARFIQIKDDATGGQFVIEGRIGGLKGSCPSVTFGVNGYSILTNPSTLFPGAACSALRNGDQVAVTGTRQADGSVVATSVKK